MFHQSVVRQRAHMTMERWGAIKGMLRLLHITVSFVAELWGDKVTVDLAVLG